MFLSALDIFKIGVGPSSSHTMGPMVAAHRFLQDLRGGVEKLPGADRLHAVKASLHGSLAFTGKGHATDKAVILGLAGFLPETLDPDQSAAIIAKVVADKSLVVAGLPPLRFDPQTDLVFDYGPALPGHANGLILRAFDQNGRPYHTETYYSIGGGFVQTKRELARGPSAGATHAVPYPFASAAEMLRMGEDSGLTIAAMKRANEEAVHGARSGPGGYLARRAVGQAPRQGDPRATSGRTRAEPAPAP